MEEPVSDYLRPWPPRKRLPLWWCALISLALALLFGLKDVDDDRYPISGFVVTMLFLAFLLSGAISLIAAVIRAVIRRSRP
jgi:hypothetical protein